MKAMRPSLLPGLVAAARRNADRGASAIRLFEIGRRYLAEGERATAAVLLAGDKAPRDWQSGKAQGYDAYDAKAEAIALLEAAGAPVANLTLTAGAGELWHPGRSATLGLGPKTVLAAFGELHPRLAKEIDAPAGMVVAEIYLDAIPAPRRRARATARTARGPRAERRRRRSPRTPARRRRKRLTPRRGWSSPKSTSTRFRRRDRAAGRGRRSAPRRCRR